MDGFTYNNIFETKGLEYLAIIAFFAILIPFWIVLNKKIRNKKQSGASAHLTSESLSIPQGLFFSKYHTWAHLDRAGFAKVGLDDLLVRITGEVTFNRLLESGEKIRKGDFIAEVMQNGKSLRIYSPISGEIMEANPVLAKNPEYLNEDPYQKGWIYKIKPFSWVTDTHSYFLAEDANMWTRQELVRFKDFVAESLAKYSSDPSAIVLQDGGELRNEPLSELPAEIWQDFQTEFLSKKSPCRNKKCFRNVE